MYFEDFEIGQTYNTPEIEITRDKMKAFAKEYDPFALHMDEEYGKKSRFKDIIAPGVMTFMYVWSEFVKMNVWEDNVIVGKSTGMEWFVPVMHKDKVRGIITIVEKTRRNPYNGIIKFRVDVFNQKDELVLIDYTEFVIASNNVNKKPD